MADRAPDSLLAAVLAPLGRDAALATSCLAAAGIEAQGVDDFPALYERIEAGVGAVMVTEEVLTIERVQALTRLMRAQPPWSDLPIIVFSSAVRGLPSRLAAHLQELGNVSFVDRPVQRRTLVAAVRSALRARQRQYEGRKAIEAREQFLAMLGHELRNPLAAIRLANDLLERRGKTAASTSKYAASVERQTNHLRRLVDDLLDVARVTSGKVSLQR
jgi:signal transduction histidine kinase